MVGVVAVVAWAGADSAAAAAGSPASSLPAAAAGAGEPAVKEASQTLGAAGA